MTHDAHGSKDRYFVPLRIAILTISDSRTEETDGSGRILVDRLTDKGHLLADKLIVPDDIYEIRAVVSRWIVATDVQVIITTGGTGLTSRDGTPEAIMPLLDKKIEGFGEMFRAVSFEEIKTATLQSRALAGIANGTYIFCLPGSSGACKTGWDKLIEAQLDYRTQPCNLAELMPQLLGMAIRT
uniref:Molybdenum cofactor biosynthesis protein B n=1 Tax=Candidatus Kentrum sp. TUN TaxID=2126343 RepID=A0A450ZJ83_9GAMM|nr:MAG: molybdenum cofactor biosynthesis protein B [Candidatus Kentron sp. TUN]VFK53820.1 MAG: molybdenum cofactor biosynthesis protein B [Candidatus Kentron sp. TUN]VFK59548.1 MAG: molybdenum cofactor biosynthesis protein B [Candidatus Kentron sp. TUN]